MSRFCRSQSLFFINNEVITYDDLTKKKKENAIKLFWLLITYMEIEQGCIKFVSEKRFHKYFIFLPYIFNRIYFQQESFSILKRRRPHWLQTIFSLLTFYKDEPLLQKDALVNSYKMIKTFKAAVCHLRYFINRGTALFNFIFEWWMHIFSHPVKTSLDHKLERVAWQRKWILSSLGATFKVIKLKYLPLNHPDMKQIF